jgi:hypothetical protein
MLDYMSYWIVQYLLPIHCAHFGSVYHYAANNYTTSFNHYNTLYHLFAIYYLVTSR